MTNMGFIQNAEKKGKPQKIILDNCFNDYGFLYFNYQKNRR